jgi:hypothetical protein
VSNWNQWVAAQGGDGTATLESVKVSQLSSYLEGYRYDLCQDSEAVAEERQCRESLLKTLHGWRPDNPSDDRYRRRVAWWKEMARDFLGELYSLRQVANAMSQRYFDGRQVLFPSKASDFARLVECIEELVEEYNQDFANKPGSRTGSSQQGLPAIKPPNLIDAAALETALSPLARQHSTIPGGYGPGRGLRRYRRKHSSLGNCGQAHLTPPMGNVSELLHFFGIN